MVKVFLGLGSNLGERIKSLEKALELIKNIPNLKFSKTSRIYENPAKLPKDCREDWNHPFLNMAVEVFYQGEPIALLDELQSIEKKMGREAAQKWSPRTIDIDILTFGEEVFENPRLTLPHPGIKERAFVTGPLRDLLGGPKALGWNRSLETAIPKFMAILNLTPDSFSDGGLLQDISFFEKELKKLQDNQISILDLGAESTRPGARKLDHQEEWERLEPFLQSFFKYYKDQPLRPQLSVDTRHVDTARKAIELGADIINDVSGAADPEMIKLIGQSQCQYVLMHSLSVPADPKQCLEKNLDPVNEIKNWLDRKLKILQEAGVDLQRVVFDPGIGFGKTVSQSLALLRNIESFYDYPVQVLVGHSRKSFMKNYSSKPAAQRDFESVGISLDLARRGVDILRVHKAELHSQALLSALHSAKDL